MRKFVVTKYEIESQKLNEAWRNTRIAVLCDFHNNTYGIDADALYQAVLDAKLDFIIVAGDMYTGHRGCDNKCVDDFMRKLADKFKIYYGLGNHEHRMKVYSEEYPGMYDAFRQMIDDTGICLLENESVELIKGDMPGAPSLVIHGLSIEQKYYRKFSNRKMEPDYVSELLGAPDKSKYNILIGHHPFYLDAYAAWGADLVLSGHLHGGMARLPFVGGTVAPDYTLFPKYDRGRFQKDDTVMILSAGLGMHTLNIRPFNPPELVVLEMK